MILPMPHRQRRETTVIKIEQVAIPPARKSYNTTRQIPTPEICRALGALKVSESFSLPEKDARSLSVMANYIGHAMSRKFKLRSGDGIVRVFRVE